MYSPREVAEIVGLLESRVRYWAQTGVVGPSARKDGRGAYTFQDLVSVKAAKELLDKGASLQAVRKSLDALRAQLPAVTRPLAELRIVSDGERLLVAGNEPFDATTGQLVMDFAVGELEGRAAEVAALKHEPARATERGERSERKRGSAEPVARPAARAETAYAWFVEGARLESSEKDDEAIMAYEKALAGDPNLAAAHTNLGALLHRRGERDDARRHFEAALAVDPEQPEARYDLANLLDEEGDHERALAEWYRVLSLCPQGTVAADAHWNLASAHLRDGATARAKTHLTRYLALEPQGPWADRARKLL
jgi:tetratricopeptide (TPR) repeat protein